MSIFKRFMFNQHEGDFMSPEVGQEPLILTLNDFAFIDDFSVFVIPLLTQLWHIQEFKFIYLRFFLFPILLFGGGFFIAFAEAQDSVLFLNTELGQSCEFVNKSPCLVQVSHISLSHP